MSRQIKLHTATHHLLSLAIAGVLSLTAHSAMADDTTWAATATKAFLPSLLQAPASAGSSTAQLQAKLSRASQTATPLSQNDARSIHVVLSLKPRDSAGLNQWLANPQNSTTSLSKQAFLQRFAPSQAQVDAVVAHLKTSGFTSIQVAPNRLLIEATGPAQAVQQAFHTHLNHFQFEGRDVITNTSDALVPTALAGTVQAVIGLQTAVQAHTLHHIKSQPANTRSASPQATGGSVSPHQTTDFPLLYNANQLPTGSQTVVGIITAYDLSDTLSNLKHFASDHHLSYPNTQVIKTGSGTYSVEDDATGEWSLDSQTILGVTGGVKKLQFYNAPTLSNADLLKAYNAAVNDGSAKVINVSLGEDETASRSDGSLASTDSLFKVAAAQGQTFSVSSGDEGVYEAQQGYIPSNNLASYSVGSPASSPWALAIGGTEISTQGSTGYSNEVTWNEGVTWYGRLWATGGGISKYETPPTWQSSLLGSKLTKGKRVLPDFSFDAASDSGALVYLNGSYTPIGGTSLASPIFTGLWARIESAHGNGLGFAAPILYPLAAANPTALHDVVAGNNGYNGYGYTATPGWDYPTGWGSFDTAAINRLIKANR